MRCNFHQKQCFIFSAQCESCCSCQAITSCFFPFFVQDSTVSCGNYGQSKKADWCSMRELNFWNILSSERFSSSRTVESLLDTARQILRGAVIGTRGLLNPCLDPGMRIRREKGGRKSHILLKTKSISFPASGWVGAGSRNMQFYCSLMVYKSLHPRFPFFALYTVRFTVHCPVF